MRIPRWLDTLFLAFCVAMTVLFGFILAAVIWF